MDDWIWKTLKCCLMAYKRINPLKRFYPYPPSIMRMIMNGEKTGWTYEDLYKDRIQTVERNIQRDIRLRVSKLSKKEKLILLSTLDLIQKRSNLI